MEEEEVNKEKEEGEGYNFFFFENSKAKICSKHIKNIDLLLV